MSTHSWFDFRNSSTRRGLLKRPSARRFNLEALEDRALLSFSPGVAYPVGPNPSAVITADFNSDSRADLALTVSNSVDVLLGNGDGTFQAAQNWAAASGTRSLAAGDLNADGTIDLVTADHHSGYREEGSISLLFGNGDGTFQPPVNSQFGDKPISVAMGDLDGDGDLDIVSTTKFYVWHVPQWDYYVSVFLNDLDPVNHVANLKFEHAYYLYTDTWVSRWPDSIQIASINGHPSVVFSNLDGSTSVMLGNGTGALQSPVSISTGASRGAVGDVNGDGKNDLLTPNSDGVSVRLGTGSASPLFESAVTYAAGADPTSVTLGDINANGVPDVVVANGSSSSVSVLVGNGDGTFQSAENYATGSFPVGIAVGNFNGDSSADGKPYHDLAVANSGDNSVSVLLNASSVVGRHVFYNQSKFDGNSAAIDAADNSAIAVDKTAYRLGDGLAGFDNITSYTRGINGIMVDITGSHPGITADDFVFKVGNNDSRADWATIAPASMSVIAGGGVGGSDRVAITWANGVIKNQWLEVQVRATIDTGLPTPDVHFWGNRIGDSGTGTPATVFETTTTDAAQVNATITGSAAIDNLRDYNRSGNVTSTDAAIVNANIGTLARIDIDAGGQFAPQAAPASALDDGATSAVASALTAQQFIWDTQACGPCLLVNRVDDAAGEGTTAASSPETSRAEIPREGLLAKLAFGFQLDPLAVDVALDDDLLDALLDPVWL
jgi:hypothetical protein